MERSASSFPLYGATLNACTYLPSIPAFFFFASDWTLPPWSVFPSSSNVPLPYRDDGSLSRVQGCVVLLDCTNVLDGQKCPSSARLVNVRLLELEHERSLHCSCVTVPLHRNCQQCLFWLGSYQGQRSTTGRTSGSISIFRYLGLIANRAIWEY
ncbi:hypothetical protein K474DRAFT_1669364 [Panus rudis PR-1116 ss-1]|nr:hypothetical protein K474DRAFT_1669364 [Panus rudis PR-1116 ss-1]